MSFWFASPRFDLSCFYVWAILCFYSLCSNPSSLVPELCFLVKERNETKRNEGTTKIQSHPPLPNRKKHGMSNQKEKAEGEEGKEGKAQSSSSMKKREEKLRMRFLSYSGFCFLVLVVSLLSLSPFLLLHPVRRR